MRTILLTVCLFMLAGCMPPLHYGIPDGKYVADNCGDYMVVSKGKYIFFHLPMLHSDDPTLYIDETHECCFDDSGRIENVYPIADTQYFLGIGQFELKLTEKGIEVNDVGRKTKRLFLRRQGVFPVLDKDFGTVMEIEGIVTDKPLDQPGMYPGQKFRINVLYVDNIRLDSPKDIELVLIPDLSDIKSGSLVRLVGYESVAAKECVVISTSLEDEDANDHCNMNPVSFFFAFKRLPENHELTENNAETMKTTESYEVPSWWMRQFGLESLKVPIVSRGTFPILGNKFGIRMTVQGKLINHNSPGSKREDAYPDYSLEVSKINGTALDVRINIRLECFDPRPSMPTGGEATLVGYESLRREVYFELDIDPGETEYKYSSDSNMIGPEKDFAIENIFHVQKIENISLPRKD
ncbi:MAG: hypothetical protein AB7F40_09555 [Victivallaceae bacterium]|nr:hypothetical protein [Victivallaceae bacterium]